MTPNDAMTAGTVKRFVETMGQMTYNAVKRKPQHWRLAYAVDARCEVEGCLVAGMESGLVFDHCHAHGWVRAVLCARHNARMGLVDALVREEGLDFSMTRYGPILASCPDCATLELCPRHGYDLRREAATRFTQPF